MTVISKAAIREFSEKYDDALEPLLHWYHVTKKATWKDLAETQKDFPHADFVHPHTVFNIAGNKYRLVAVIKYRWQIIHICHILTHSECDKGKWKS